MILQCCDPLVQDLWVLLFVWIISWIVYIIINNSAVLLLTKNKEILWCNAQVHFSKRCEWWCNISHVNGLDSHLYTEVLKSQNWQSFAGVCFFIFFEVWQRLRRCEWLFNKVKYTLTVMWPKMWSRFEWFGAKSFFIDNVGKYLIFMKSDFMEFIKK